MSNERLICPNIKDCNVYQEYAKATTGTAEEDVIFRLGKTYYCMALTQRSPATRARTASCGCLNLSLLNKLESNL